MHRAQPSAALLHAPLFLALVALATAAAAQSIYQKELVTNGDAESIVSEGWSTHDTSMQVTRADTVLSGKRGDYFFRGQEGTASAPAPAEVSMFQLISLGEAGEDIDAGHVAVGFSALMGGFGAADSSVKVHLTFMNAVSTKLGSAEIIMDTADRMSKDLLALRTTTVCDVPVKTRQVILTVAFQYTPGAPHSSDAAIDGMSLRVLNRIPPPFAALDNLVPAPSAETPAVTCLWGSPELGIAPAVTDADGFYVFATNSSAKITANLWIDVSADSAEIDAKKRHASLSALIGGSAGASGQASLAFYDKDKNAIDVHMALNTGEVNPEERHFMPGVLQRDQGGEVPALTRWLRLDLVFDNAGVSAAAAVDDLVVRIRPRDTMPPTGPTEPPTSPMFRRELLVNGNADEEPDKGWLQMNIVRSNATLPGKKGHFFFRGSSDSEEDAEMSQDVDLSEIVDDIKKGNVGIGLSLWAGSVSSMGDSVSIYVSSLDADYETLGERVVEADAEGRLTYRHIAMCQLEAATSAIDVYMVLTLGWGEGNAAAVDALSLRLVQDTPVKFEDDANLIPAPSAESPAAACLWANANVSVTPAYYGGDGSYQYAASVPGHTVGTRKIDISADGVAIDGESRLAILSALIGGDGPGDVTGRVTVTFLDKDSGDIGHIKTSDVTAAERDGKSELLKRSALAEIPSHARFARVDLEFVGEGASVDLVDLRIQAKAATLAPTGPTEPPTSSIFRRDLIINGGAESEMGPEWQTSETEMHVIRSTEAVSGKQGTYFFRGPHGTADEPAQDYVDFHQQVDIGEAATEIDRGEVGIGVGVMVGATGKDDSGVSVDLIFYDQDMTAMDEAESIYADTTKAELQFRTLVHCDVMAQTRIAEVYITFEYWWGDSNIAAVDAVTLGLVHTAPVKYREGANLIQAPGAESTAISCLWDGPVEATAAYAGGRGALQFTSTSTSGISYATKWVDISSESGNVDRLLRTTVVAALVGGAGSEGDSGELTVTFCDTDKKPLGSLSTGKVTAEERGGVAQLLPMSSRAQIPAESRWMKVQLVFDNAAGPGAALDSLDVRIGHNVPTLVPPAGPTEPPLSPMYARNLIVNGDAEDEDMSAWGYDSDGKPNLNRTDMALPGKQGNWFFTGPTGTEENPRDSVECYQEFSVSEVAADIASGRVAAGLSSLYGAVADTDADVTMEVYFMDEDYNGDDMMWTEHGVMNSVWSLTKETLCSVPIETRFITFSLFLDAYEGHTVLAAVDAISFRLVDKAGVAFRESANLVPLPSAESPAANCLWSSDYLTVGRAYEGGTGVLQYKSIVADTTTTATMWIDVSADSGHIDRDQRLFGLSAAVGGSGAGDNSGEVTVAFCDKDKKPIPGAVPASTGKVTAADRGNEARLVVQAAEGPVPKNTRMVKLELVFDNAAGGLGAAIDDINFFVRPHIGTLKPHPGPTPAPVSDIYGRQLIVNGDANAEIGDEWSTTDDKMFVIRSSEGLDGKNGEFFFRGPKSEGGKKAEDYIDFSQVVDISEVSADIDAGGVALGISAMAGGASDYEVEVSIEITIADNHVDSLEWYELYFNEEKHAYLAPLEWKLCTVPAGARRVEVSVMLDYYGGNSNDAAVDDISLRLLKKAAQPYAVDTNLIPVPSAESPVAACVWDSPVLDTVAAYPGGDGVFQYGVSASGKTTIALEVDVAPESREIDNGKRFAVISGLTGGAGDGDDSVSMALTFLDDGKKPIGDAPALVTDTVTGAERGELALLLQRSGHMIVPKGTRTVKYELVFHNSPTTHSAGVDSLDFRLRHEPGTLPPTKRPTRPPTLEIYGRELVVNGGAEEEVAAPWQLSSWNGNAVVRSVIALDGKVGDYFFRGPLGSTRKPAGQEATMEQPIDVAEARGDIDRGHVAAGLSAMVGCVSGDECAATLYLTYYDKDYDELGEAEMSATAADRGYEGKLVAKLVKECQLPKGTRVLEVYVSFEHKELLHNNDAAIDAISLHLLKTTSMWFQEEINLLPAPSAETPAALCVWDETKIEIAPGYPGADGRWQYQSKWADYAMVTKWINLTPATKEIDDGDRFGVVSALIGGTGWTSYSSHLDVTFCDRDKKPIGVAPSMSTGELPAANRSHVAGLQRATGGVRIPEKTRWAKVDMAFHNGLFTTGAAIDELEFSVRSALPPPIPNEKPTESVYVRNLVKNPEANAEPADGWFDGTGEATVVERSTADVTGKSGEYFFRGPKGKTGAPATWGAPMVQAIDLSSIAEDIDAGTVAVGLSALAGRVGTSSAASVALELAAIGADDVELKNEFTVVSGFSKPSNALTPTLMQMCQLPAKTRKLELHVRLSHFFTLLDNDAAVDAVEVRVIQTGLRKYVDGANLVPMPSAESPVATCVWEGEHLAIRPAYDGGGGSAMQYQSSAVGITNATTWVDISSAGATIDANQRVALLVAYVGGDGALEDSGEVTVTFYDISKHVLGHAPSMTTGTVTPVERGEATKLLQREATLMVPNGARWAKVMMVFANTALTEGAAVDHVNLRLLHKLPTPPPSGPTEPPLESIYVRQLIKNGEAMYLPKTGWESESTFTPLLVARSSQSLPGKSGRFFFRGPKGTEKKPAAAFAGMYQEVDVSEAAEDIDNGLVALGFSARLGAAAVGGASVSISLSFMSADGKYLGESFWRTVDKDARGDEAKLIEVEYTACTAPSSMRTVGVTVRFNHWGTLLHNDAAADALSLRIVRKEPVPFVLGANLLPMASAESPAATCLWGGDKLTTTAVFPGGDGTLQYSSMATSLSTVALWVDLSADSAGIAEGHRHASMTAFVGGSGAAQDSGELVVTLCDKDKHAIGSTPTMTTGVVTAADRNSLPHLLERNADATVPADARWAKVEMIFHNAATSKFAALDTLDFRILPAPPTLAPHTGPPQGDIFERELVHNGNADYEPTVGWVTSFGPLKMLRSDQALPGKTGKYFFRGPVGTSTKAASALIAASQMIDVSEAATEIDLGQVAAGFHAALGALHPDSAYMMILVDYFDDDGVNLAVTPKSVTVGPPERFGQAMLLSRYMQQCTLPAKARKAEVLVFFEHFGSEKDNDAAFDDVSLRLYKKEPVVFAEDANLAPFPHAEATFAPCAWEGDRPTLRRSAPGADGALEYTAELGGKTTATVWVDISASAGSIDKSLRHATLGAHIGGSGTEDDSGEVSVAFFDADKKPLAGASVLTTGTVTAADRANQMKLLERSAEMLVPVGARWAQLAMVFHNLNETRSFAAVDNIDFRVLPVGQTPSPATDQPTMSPVTQSPTTEAPSGSSSAAGAPTTAPAGGGAAGNISGAPVRPLASGFRAGAQAVGGIALAGSAMAGPVAAAQLGRAVAVVAAAAGCGRGSAAGDVAPLWPLSPFQMKVGASTPGAYYRGAVIGNVIAVALAALLLVGIVAALKVLKFSASTQPWHAAMAAVCFPSCLVVPVGLLAPGLMYGAIGAVTASGAGGDYVCAVLAFVIVCGAIGATAYFALTARRGTLDSMAFMVDHAQAGGVAWLLSDAGNWASTTNQVGAQLQATLQMATMLYRPYRGVLFLWWVPVDLAVTATVAGAAGAAGTGCRHASIVVALFLSIQVIAVLTLRPHACRMRNTLVALAGAVAAVAAAIFVAVAHRNDADPVRLAHDGLLGLIAVLAIIAALLFLLDGVLATVKLILECRQRKDVAANTNLEILFGGNLGQELVSEGMQESMAGADDQEAGPMLAATTTLNAQAGKRTPPPIMESEDGEPIVSVPAVADDEEL